MTMKKKKKNQISTSSLSTDDHDHKKNKKMKVVIGTIPNGGEVNLTEDLILEIFTHLPPISLLRFKSVSKTLHSLISNPDFLRRNTVDQFRRSPGIILLKNLNLERDPNKIHLISPSPLHGYYYYYSKFVQNLIDNYGLGPPEHDQPQGEKKFVLIDSCNGLLLVRNRNPPVGKKCSWYVCNPVTKDYIKLPTFEQEEGQGLMTIQGLTIQGIKILPYWWAKLVFDPSLSLTYKVVIWLHEYGMWRLYVYSSDTRSWRLSVSLNNNDFAFRDVLDKQSFIHCFRAVLLNGVLYYWNNDMDVSLCYDVEKDSVWILKFPQMPLEYVERKLFYFGVCDGGLRLIQKYYKHGYGKERTFRFSFDVMEINQLQLQQQHQDHQDGNIDNDKDLWTVKYRVNIGVQEGYYANLIRENSSCFGVFILDLYKTTTTTKAGGGGAGEVEEVLMCINDRLVISFNLWDNTFGKELRNNELRLKDRIFGLQNVIRYAFTLFPLIH